MAGPFDQVIFDQAIFDADGATIVFARVREDYRTTQRGKPWHGKPNDGYK